MRGMVKKQVGPLNRVLVANRGEIAIRIINACHELAIETVALYTENDRAHAVDATIAVQLDSPSQYMDVAKIVAVAKQHNVKAVAPGYGFLSESADFAAAVWKQGIIFIGPTPQVLDTLGDKAKAKAIAREVGVPTLPSADVANIDQVKAFAEQVGCPVMIKAQDGGGGRGIRIVQSAGDIERAFMEATNESPSRRVFCEKAALTGYKHIEVQIVGDLSGNVVHIFERECSLQRRFQKVIEIAPSSLPRERIAPVIEASLKLAKHVKYIGLGTFEFLVNARADEFYFMECNPRIQVEHTITEQISGIDLVHLQLKVCLERYKLAELRVPAEPIGYAIQCRVNTEDPTTFAPASGLVTAHALPAGRGVRVDSLLSNCATHLVTDEFDNMLVKVIASARTYRVALRRATAAVRALRIEGVDTNRPLLIGLLRSNLLHRPTLVDVTTLSNASFVGKIVKAGQVYLDKHAEQAKARLGGGKAAAGAVSSQALLSSLTASADAAIRAGDQFELTAGGGERQLLEVVRVRRNDFPREIAAEVRSAGGGAVRSVALKKATGATRHERADPKDERQIGLPFAGVLVELLVEQGDVVKEGEPIAVLRQMKMELDVRAPKSGTVTRIAADLKEGERVGEGALICVLDGGVDSKAKL